MPKKTFNTERSRKSNNNGRGRSASPKPVKQRSVIMPTADLTINDLVDAETLKVLTPAEERRLKADIKRGVDIKNSEILKGIVGRCPRLAQNINKIVNSDPFAGIVDDRVDANASGKNPTNDQTNQNSKKRRAVEVIDAEDHQPKTKRNKLSEQQRIANEKAKSKAAGKTSDKKPTSGIKRKTRSQNPKSLIKTGFKRPIYDKDVGEIVEDLGSDDSDDDSVVGPNEYVNDGFVVNTKTSRYGTRSKSASKPSPKGRPNARISKKRSIDESDTEDDDMEVDPELDDDMDDDSEMDLEAELNDLYDDTIANTEGMTEEQILALNQKMRGLRDRSSDMKVTVDMIVKANFNKDDEVWFYRNIRERLPMLEGNERFQLEDKIERRYRFLTSLQASNMYNNFFKGGERDIMEEILASKQPDSVKSVLLNRLCSVTYESMEEYQKALGWMDVVLSIPTEVKSSKNEITKSLTTLYHKLSTNMHGMDSTIREILQAVCSILTDPDSKGSILTLVGPPGVGKTTISSMISEAIGMGFGQVSCGSINDQATITGHGSTYIGSKPGVFTQYLITNGQLDNVILLDELDKLHDSKIVPILLHVLDKSQNSRFRDAFCPEINIDLSKNLYVIAVNSVDNLDEALKDRLKIVHVNGYTVETKTQICMKHIIPVLNKRTGIELHIDEDTVRRCVKKISPNVSGVRDVERLFGDIYEKILLITRMGGELFNLPKSVKIESLKKIDAKLIKQLIGVEL